MTATPSRVADRWQAEDGEGLFSTVFGLMLFLLLLLFAVQVTTHLYATTVVTTAAFDAARLVSGQQVLGSSVGAPTTDCPAPAAAEIDRANAHLASLLGGLWEVDAADWTGTDASRVTVEVTVQTPARVIGGVASVAGLDQISRTVTLQRECFR